VNLFLLVAGVLGLMVVRVPVAFALLAPSIVYVWLSDQLTMNFVMLRITNALDSFPLLAVPLFIFMGMAANASGITERIFNFCEAFLGHIRGAHGYVNIAGSFAFSWMSGAAVADAAGIGSIEVPEMVKRGYEDRFSVGLTAASAVIGPIMPPSIPAIIYSAVAGVSIGAVFVAGIIPAILITGVLCVYVFLYARDKPHLRLQRATPRQLVRASGGALLSLLTGVIVLGGILGGVFTPTEAAAIAGLYITVLGLCYRRMKVRDLYRLCVATAETTAGIMLIVAGASLFGWILAREQGPQTIAAAVTGLTDNPIVFLLLVNVLLLVVGMLIDPLSAMLIMVPVLLPLAIGYGVDPLHFGSLLILNLMIGLLTPPVGIVLYVLSQVTNIPLPRVVQGTMPFLLPLGVCLLLVTFIPALTLWLPAMFGFR
jgi:tripartite ATP-independent transporter DctM subunit